MTKKETRCPPRRLKPRLENGEGTEIRTHSLFKDQLVLIDLLRRGIPPCWLLPYSNVRQQFFHPSLMPVPIAACLMFWEDRARRLHHVYGKSRGAPVEYKDAWLISRRSHPFGTPALGNVNIKEFGTSRKADHPMEDLQILHNEG